MRYPPCAFPDISPRITFVMKILTSAVLLLFALPAFATDIITIGVSENEDFGPYLTVSEGRPLYVFSTDTRATDDQLAEISCTSAECLDTWRMVITSDTPQAGAGVDASLLGTVEHNHRQIVTYDGWPLYYFASGDGSVPPQSNKLEAFEGEWSLVGPDSTVSADIAAGEAMFADACAQCHGRTGRGMASFPSLTGKDAAHIADLLRQYRAGETVGPSSALMKPVAAVLSDEDIADLSVFISEEFP